MWKLDHVDHIGVNSTIRYLIIDLSNMIHGVTHANEFNQYRT